MDMNKIYKQNSIDRKIIELEQEKQKLYDLGLDDEDRYNKFMELDDEIDELMMEHEMI
ncbi:hypothetical protein [Clostridium beijerinckii]|uniref:Uncharacterized protein n=1 Tax=Clostridium beijerinckii TaxID=1520 RepID=A0AAX0B0E0_CLOBE|nr:hypothetical protein [Clostridium beijerinckii]NRT88551.1 hypothetical protein [Clostridium beijerinckii]